MSEDVKPEFRLALAALMFTVFIEGSNFILELTDRGFATLSLKGAILLILYIGSGAAGLSAARQSGIAVRQKF